MQNINGIEQQLQMTFLISIIPFLIFLFLSVLHIYWSFGGQWGKDVTIPTKENNIKVISPGVFINFRCCIIFFGSGIFILIEAKILNIQTPVVVSKYGPWIIVLIFLIRAIGEFKYVGFFKKIRHTKFGKNDTNYYSPLCLAIGILTMILELLK